MTRTISTALFHVAKRVVIYLLDGIPGMATLQSITYDLAATEDDNDMSEFSRAHQSDSDVPDYCTTALVPLVRKRIPFPLSAPFIFDFFLCMHIRSTK